MTCRECSTELTGDTEYDFSLCVGCQTDENETTVITEEINEKGNE